MISSLAQLEACLGNTPAAMGLKVIDHLDEGALRWIAASPLAFLAAARADGVEVTIAGGDAGFARPASPTQLVLPASALDDASLPCVGRGIGTLFLVPGVGETLRVNGRVTAVSEAGVVLGIDEVYVHCAKALLRSSFWSAPVRDDGSCGDLTRFIHEARFVALATADAEGRADLSPKGDAAGNMLKLSDNELSYAERPGNRRKDSLKNLLTQPRAAALAVVPGSCWVAQVSGDTRIVDDEAARTAFTAEGKTPKLVTTIVHAKVALRESPALKRAAVWPVRTTAHGLDPAAILTAHIKLNKTGGLAASLMRMAISKTLMSAGLRHDYKSRMY
jgi:uncharacterized protein